MKIRSSLKCIACFMIFFFSPVVNGEEVSNYVGLQIPPIPEGHIEREAFLVDDKPGSSFALSRMIHTSGEAILLQKLLYYDKEGHAHWIVTSALAEPTQQKDCDYFIGTCMLNGEHQRDIIALVKSEDQEIQTEIIRAWRVNVITQKIEKIPVNNITCYIEGWGHN